MSTVFINSNINPNKNASNAKKIEEKNENKNFRKLSLISQVFRPAGFPMRVQIVDHFS